MTDSRFGLSTRLFSNERLDRPHLDLLATHGFTALELLARRPHFDCADTSQVDALAGGLAGTGQALHAVTVDTDGGLGSGDTATRARAVEDVRAALGLATRVPFRYLVVPLDPAGPATSHPQPAAIRRSLEEIAEAAGAAGVAVAVETRTSALSRPDALVRLIEEDLDELGLGICLDFGAGQRLGDLPGIIEEVGGHMVTTHVHDARGRDQHLVPFAGVIDWDAAMMETQKIGYDGRLMLDVAAQGSAVDLLERCATARDRLRRAFEWTFHE